MARPPLPKYAAFIGVFLASCGADPPKDLTCGPQDYVKHRVESFCALSVTLFGTDYWDCVDQNGEGGDWARETTNFLWYCDEAQFDCAFARACSDVEYTLAARCSGWSQDCWEVEPEYEFYTECRLYRMDTNCLLEL